MNAVVEEVVTDGVQWRFAQTRCLGRGASRHPVQRLRQPLQPAIAITIARPAGIGAALGLRATASLNLPRVLDSELRGLATSTDETVILAVPEFSSGLARYVATSTRASACASPPRWAGR